MTHRVLTFAPLAVAAVAAALLSAPAATAIDPCKAAVSSSRCLGPTGIDGFAVPSSGGSARNGPYGSWGNIPPLG